MKEYGPYTRKDGRKHMVIVHDDGRKQTISYPKYLIQKHLGRELHDNETVDHINRDKTDDRIENLKVVERSEHCKLDATYVKKIEITCKLCGAKAFKNGNDLRWNEKQGKSGPFCSASCVGKYGRLLQLGKINRLDRDSTPEAEYYKIENKYLTSEDNKLE